MLLLTLLQLLNILPLKQMPTGISINVFEKSHDITFQMSCDGFKVRYMCTRLLQ